MGRAGVATKVIVVAAGALQALAAGLGVVALNKAAVHWFQRSPRRRPERQGSGGHDGVNRLTGDLSRAPWVIEGLGLSRTFGVSPSRFLGGLLAVPKGWLIKSGHGFDAVSLTFLALMTVVISGPVTFAFLLGVACKTRETKPLVGWVERSGVPNDDSLRDTAADTGVGGRTVRTSGSLLEGSGGEFGDGFSEADEVVARGFL